MSARSSRSVEAADPSVWIDLLERVLRAQLEGHQQLLACIERKREAIRAADIDLVTTICGEENVVIQKLAGLEKHRLELLGRITAVLRPRAETPLGMSEIAEIATEPQRSRLQTISAQLRQALTDAQRQSSIVRAAAEALSRHMTGIVQTVHSALSRARVYGQRGRIACGIPLSSAVDLKS